MEEQKEQTAESTLELGIALGQTNAFGLIAGRCSAAQAEEIRRIREHKLYKYCTDKWEDFCAAYLNISRAEADRDIKLLDEFGPAYFELSQVTRVSPETFRAIAPKIKDGVLHHKGQAIEMTAANSRRLAAAVSEMRAPRRRKNSDIDDISRQIQDLLHDEDVNERATQLVHCCLTIFEEFDKILADPRLSLTRITFHRQLVSLRDELTRLVG